MAFYDWTSTSSNEAPDTYNRVLYEGLTDGKGCETLSDDFWENLKICICTENNLAVALLQRTEKKEQQMASNPFHCLLIVGIIPGGRRRRSQPIGFLVKVRLPASAFWRPFYVHVSPYYGGWRRHA
jgi:hypothetical protein